MIEIRHYCLIIGLCTSLFSVSANADGFIKKEVYSFKDKSGNIVFTDRKPAEKQAFKTQTIEAANSTANSYDDSQNNVEPQNSYNQQEEVGGSYIVPTQTVRIIVEDGSAQQKKSYKKKRSIKTCKTYKKKFTYFSDKMKSGYKNSEYKKLESNRQKYKNLLFNNCDTNTFND